MSDNYVSEYYRVGTKVQTAPQLRFNAVEYLSLSQILQPPVNSGSLRAQEFLCKALSLAEPVARLSSNLRLGRVDDIVGHGVVSISSLGLADVVPVITINALVGEPLAL